MFQTEVVDKIKTYLLCSVLENCDIFLDNVEEYSKAREAIDNNMAHLHSTLDT
jgi:hypothetical protein